MITPPPQLGFLTIVENAGGYSGGYLVTNLWGRPLEFRLSTPVQPNRIQQILYADTLADYLCGEIIGKSLLEKTAMPAAVVLTDRAEVLPLYRFANIPVVWVSPANDPRTAAMAVVRPAERDRGPIVVPDACSGAIAPLRELFERLSGLDLAEPFARVREAVAEARKLGVVSRAG